MNLRNFRRSHQRFPSFYHFLSGAPLCGYMCSLFFLGKKVCEHRNLKFKKGYHGTYTDRCVATSDAFFEYFFAPLRVREKLSGKKKLKQVFVCLFCCIFSRLLPPSSFLQGVYITFRCCILLQIGIFGEICYGDWMCVVASICFF